LAPVYLALAVLTLVLILLDLASVRWAFPLDRHLSHLMIRARTREETKLMHWASVVGGPYGIIIVAILATFGLAVFGRPLDAVFYLMVVVLSVAYALSMKVLTARKRPNHGIEKQRTYSFPSAHSLTSAVMYISLGILLAGSLIGDIVLILCIALVLAIGVSRVYLGVHYPSDVLGGYVAGGVWVWIFLYLVAGT